MGLNEFFLKITIKNILDYKLDNVSNLLHFLQFESSGLDLPKKLMWTK